MEKIKKFINKHIIIILMICTIFLTGGKCLIKDYLGIPCPSCGITRAYKAILHFDIRLALFYHPLFWLIPVYILVIIYGKKPILGNEKRQMYFYVIGAMIIISVYLYRMYLYFPNVAPMDFNDKSILGLLRHIFASI